MVTNNSCDYSPTQYNVQSGGASGTLNNIAPSTSGYVLTSNGASSQPTFQAAGSGGITTIDGDTGSVTGSTISIVNAASGTPKFTGSGSTLTLAYTDSAVTLNTVIGSSTPTSAQIFPGVANTAYGANALGGGNAAAVSGASDNTAIGSGALFVITSAVANTAIGHSTLDRLLTGILNIAIGSGSGANYTGAESGNIVIGPFGTTGESNKTRIGYVSGTASTQTACFIDGITGVTPNSGNVPQVTLCDNEGNLAPISSSTAGFVLTSNGTATPSFQSIAAAPYTITTVNNAASPYTVLSADQFLAVDVTGGVVTIKLPNAPTTGRVIYVKDSKGLAATSNISVTTVGGAVTIDGATTQTMNVNYQSLTVIFDGTSYQVF